MLRALYSSASGMQSQQLNLDVISNNLANVNTTGFKESRPQFQDLLYDTTKAAGSQQGGGNQLPASLQVGQGSVPVATERIFTQGELSQTGGNLDMAIQGNGFFEVQMPDGTLAYTRDGGFKTDSQGRVVTSEGYPVQGGFQPVPPGTTNITITASGAATYTTASGSTNFQIQLANFNNPGGLDAMGHNLYKETSASGTPELGTPGANGFGQIEQGSLELSNVSVVKEMVNLILAQRAYEVNSKAVQAADEMMQTSNNLQR
ncbi:MAG TPA: flagellar basal-body rod protein FlgG [Candidatus Acidoferrales bacterium]|jgi:flagellar basal-body rod protein FlgG|nr:flagellar basal-body rod protein FlgG [Candidatus Acidoferrales bacterium]